MALRVGGAATGADAFVADVADVDEDAPEPQPAATVAGATAKTARRQAQAGRARIATRISGARIGAVWGEGAGS